jgi:hypothetical protein
MQQHDNYGKLIVGRAAGCNCDGPRTITSYGESSARIDGTVGSTIAVEIDSRTPKQVRGAILDLILHAYPKKLLILVPMHIGKYQVPECEFILKRFVAPKDFSVVLLDGTGDNPSTESDVSKVRCALQALGWVGAPGAERGVIITAPEPVPDEGSGPCPN